MLGKLSVFEDNVMSEGCKTIDRMRLTWVFILRLVVPVATLLVVK